MATEIVIGLHGTTNYFGEAYQKGTLFFIFPRFCVKISYIITKEAPFLKLIG